MLLNHPADQTDPFILLLKSVILLGKVKTFNVRFRNKYTGTAFQSDPRAAPEFIELDKAVASFREAWPKAYQEEAAAVVATDGKLNPTLYLASLLPNLSVTMTLNRLPLLPC